MIENDAHGMAKSLVFRRNQGVHGRPVGIVRLIRRNGQVVPWVSRSGCGAQVILSLHMDSTPALEMARDRPADGSGQAFATSRMCRTRSGRLMQQGHFKVAESAIVPAHRARRGKAGVVEASRGESMIVVTELNGENTFWDGLDLARIDFAMIGLDWT